jgi:hypothetical protein
MNFAPAPCTSPGSHGRDSPAPKRGPPAQKGRGQGTGKPEILERRFPTKKLLRRRARISRWWWWRRAAAAGRIRRRVRRGRLVCRRRRALHRIRGIRCRWRRGRGIRRSIGRRRLLLRASHDRKSAQAQQKETAFHRSPHCISGQLPRNALAPGVDTTFGRKQRSAAGLSMSR